MTTTTYEQMKADGERQQREFNVIRDAWRIQEPRLHKCPQWFTRLVRRTIRERRLPCQCRIGDIVSLLWSTPYRSLFDHCGTITVGGRKVFVGEPYANLSRASDLAAELAGILGCDWDIALRSWWYPGSTIRIYFRERSEPTP